MKKPTPLEKTFQAKVTKFLKTLPGCWYVKVSDRAQAGIPDILASIRGRFIAIELKRSEKEKPTPLQIHTLQQIHASGGFTIVGYPENWIQIKAALEVISTMPIPNYFVDKYLELSRERIEHKEE